jgi:hypothetical protein
VYMSVASTYTQGISDTSSILLYVYISFRRYSSDLTSSTWRTRYQDTATYNSLGLGLHTIV